MKNFSFKQGTKFTRGGKTFISGGSTRHPAHKDLRIVLLYSEKMEPEGWLFLEEMQKELESGFIQLQIDEEYIQEIANLYCTERKKEDLVSKIYWFMKASGLDPVIVNSKYLEIGGNDYQFIRRKVKNGYGHWYEVKKF